MEQAQAPGRTTAMVPCSWLEICWGLCTGWAWSAWVGLAGALCPCSLWDLGQVTHRLWALPPPMLNGAQGSLSVPEDSMWHVAGVGRGGLGSLVLTMSEAHGSGRLAPGEILATGDILCSSFSVGGNVLDRPGWEMAQPLSRGPLAWDTRPPPPASQHLLPVDWHPGGGPRPPRGLLAASRCWSSRGPGR